MGTVNFLLRAASVDEDVFYFHVCHQARQKAVVVVELGYSSWDAGALLPGHFQGYPPP